jgi:hypothetical protein
MRNVLRALRLFGNPDQIRWSNPSPELMKNKRQRPILRRPRADMLLGNQGKDIFVHKPVEASTLSDMDTISAFDGAAGNRINLKTIDAESGLKHQGCIRFHW